MREVSLQVFFHHFPQGNDAFLLALAADLQLCVPEIKVIKGEARQLAHADPRGVQHLQHRAIAQAQDALGVRLGEKLADLPLGEDVARELVVELGKLKVGARIEEHGIRFQQVQEELPSICQAFPFCAMKPRADAL